VQVTVHKPNTQHVKNEAARIKAEGDYTGDQDLNFYEWKTGENNLRVCPPWSAKGLVFKKLLSHFELPPEKSIHRCQLTWPDKFNMCLIDEALEKVQAMFPEADLGRQRAGINYYANVIDRDEEEKGVQVCRFTEGMYNWITLQMDNPKIGDITDYEKGYDLVITKTVKPRKGGGTNTKYSCSFIPGASPLHESDEAMSKWLTSLFDIDRVFGPLDDEAIAEMQGAASRMITYYQRRFRGSDGGSAPADTETPSGVASEPAGQPTGQSTGAAPPAESSAASAPAETLSDIDPKKVPSCHASLEAPDAHEDGTYGFNPMMEKCLLCPHEMACMDAKASKGI
jgi:hypothetical protein